jgi:hypothetical protein
LLPHRILQRALDLDWGMVRDEGCLCQRAKAAVSGGKNEMGRHLASPARCEGGISQSNSGNPVKDIFRFFLLASLPSRDH